MTNEDYQPRKRLFILLMGVAGLAIIALAFLLWYIPTVGLGHIHPWLPWLFGLLLALVSLLVLGSLTLLVLTLVTGHDLFISNRLRKLVIRTVFPAIINLGKLFGIDRDTLQQSFIALNNQLVRAKKVRVRPDKALILLPHCVQLFDCDIKITGDVNKCIRCGRCNISDLAEIASDRGIDIAVATGGTLARKIIVDKRPEFILAVACERDLTSGIRDSYPLPVIGILNHRPHGPCFNTHVIMDEVRQALDTHVLPPDAA
ncbi:MAG: DUF116 domain-containing protein [Deltaproteobacteria bacterium]|nr:MAG: DUF116 domain-containing protein [Deltaproteobacteria bacterium]